MYVSKVSDLTNKTKGAFLLPCGPRPGGARHGSYFLPFFLAYLLLTSFLAFYLSYFLTSFFLSSSLPSLYSLAFKASFLSQSLIL